MRKISKVAPDWWDYTTLDDEILNDAAGLGPDDLVELSRPGFTVAIYDTVEEFYLAEALEYVNASRLEVTVPVFSAATSVLLEVREAGAVVAVPFEITDPPDFIRGDVDGDLDVDMTDASSLAGMVVGDSLPPAGQPNRDAWDVNDDGVVDFGDSVALFAYLFEGGAPPFPPFPEEGQDPTDDGICQ